VSSTETGVIFGSILWEGPNLSEACVILNDIHIDIMDYIKPAYCNEAQVTSTITIHSCIHMMLKCFLHSSGACGPNSSGRTGLTSITQFRMAFPLDPPLRLNNVVFFPSDPREYLKHVMKSTNMSCLTPEGATSGDCDFLSANMYARSLFGECF
jgi:coatomer subunit beta